MMTHKEPLGDFILQCDFKISPKCNSGIFVRTFPLTPLPGKDVGWNGIEVAIDDTTEAGYVDTGAIYDLSKPTKNNMEPAGEWNHIEITCKGPVITVVLNGEKVNECDLSKFTGPNNAPTAPPKFDHVRHARRRATSDYRSRSNAGTRTSGSHYRTKGGLRFADCFVPHRHANASSSVLFY